MKVKGGRPVAPVPNNPYGLCGRKENIQLELSLRVQELWESRGVIRVLMVSVDAKQH